MLISRAVIEGLSATHQALVRATLEALVEADVADVAEAVAARVFPPGANVRRVVDAAGALDPFVELMLHELQFAARAPGWTHAMRVEAARKAIDSAGF